MQKKDERQPRVIRSTPRTEEKPTGRVIRGKKKPTPSEAEEARRLEALRAIENAKK